MRSDPPTGSVEGMVSVQPKDKWEERGWWPQWWNDRMRLLEGPSGCGAALPGPGDVALLETLDRHFRDRSP